MPRPDSGSTRPPCLRNTDHTLKSRYWGATGPPKVRHRRTSAASIAQPAISKRDAYNLPILAACLLALGGLPGCGGSDEETNAPKSTAPQPTQSAPGQNAASLDTGGRNTPGRNGTQSPAQPFADTTTAEDTGPPFSMDPPPDAHGDLDPAARQQLREFHERRRRLDRTVWAPEVRAQQYNLPLVRLWDRIRATGEKFRALAQLPFNTLTLGSPAEPTQHQHNIRVTRYTAPDDADSPRTLTASQFRNTLKQYRSAGYRLVMNDWHMERFEHEAAPPRSVHTVNLYVIHPQRGHRLHIHARVRVQWAPRTDDESPPRPDRLTVLDARITERTGPPLFTTVMRIDPSSSAGRATPITPLMLHDLDRNGRSDIIAGGANAIYWNEGPGEFRQDRLLPENIALQEDALIADFTGDGHADLVCAENQSEQLRLYPGGPDGRFTGPPRMVNGYETPITNISGLTAGDIDADGDLDLFVPQYEVPYRGGQFPTPYYNANDGHPAYLFRNEGGGRFTDVTEQAGLAPKRHRRTYSSSFVDIDADSDLDLLVVSDFSGVDLYLNDGTGHFTDRTGDLLPERHTFGMAHTFDDFNRDGHLDFYAIGMSSPTARRLERMGLGLEDHPDHQRMRPAMAYGNRMYLGAEAGPYTLPDFSDAIARTRWSWGTSSFDLENDGDPDLYVANGHISGQSTDDYCSMFWRHDIYAADSEPRRIRDRYFADLLRHTQSRTQSWEGYQKNVLFLNEGDGFLNAAFPLGIGYDFDGRGVVTDDLDADGRMDLLVVERGRGTANAQRIHVMRNTGPASRHWIGVRLHAQPDGPSPVGARVVLHTDAGPRTAHLVTGDSFWSQHANLAHFGLGEDPPAIQSIAIHRPNGETTRLQSPAIDQYHRVPAENVPQKTGQNDD